ncbi:MAG: peptidoglycan DD-metalloendopeptidase family protein [Bacillota bacterium]
MKKFPEDKGAKKGIKEFLDKKGFYVILLLCIAVVAGTAIFVSTRNAISKQPDYDARNIDETEDGLLAENVGLNQSEELNAQEPEDTQASAAAGQQSDIGNPASINNSESESAAKIKDDENKTNKQDETDTKPKSDPKPSKSSTPVKKQSFKMPVSGEVILEFAKDKLVYSKTLEEWRTHPGVDLAAERGTPIAAVADGVVCDVRNEKYYGISVIIDHGDGLKTLYRNLASDDTVVVNQKVRQGEIIGSIGDTAMDESSDPPHLHFEVLKDDVNVDPMAYLPKTAAE